jgi:hypothetical protein
MLFYRSIYWALYFFKANEYRRQAMCLSAYSMIFHVFQSAIWAVPWVLWASVALTQEQPHRQRFRPHLAVETAAI